MPPPRRSHFRETADHSMSPPPSPLPLQSSPAVGDVPVRNDPHVNPLLPLQPPGIPEPRARHELSFPLPPLHTDSNPRRHTPKQIGLVDLKTVHQFPTPEPRPRLQHPAVGPGSPPYMERRRPVTCNEALLRPFPEPVHLPPPNVGPTRFTPPRNKLTIPNPLAQSPPRGSGSAKKSRTSTIPPPDQRVLPNQERNQEPRLRRHSQPIPVSHRATNPNSVPRPSGPSSRNAHRRPSQLLPVLQEVSHPNVSPPSSPQLQPRRVSSPPLSALPQSRPNRSNAIHRKPPGPSSLTRTVNHRTSLLAELRNAPPVDDTTSLRYPVLRPGSGFGSPPRNDRTRPPPSPRTPTFVNTHMLPPPTNSPRSDSEEWASAVSSLPSVRTHRS